MSVRHALLAILTEGTCYGYQLRAEHVRRTGAATPLNVGQIYNTLDRLERDGLVVKGSLDDAGHVPYTITGAGRAEVDGWLAESVVGVPLRDELLTKVALALSLPHADALDVIRIQRTRSRDELASVGAAREELERRGAAAPIPEQLAVDAQDVLLRARLAWLDAAEARIRVAREVGVVPSGLAEAPRRGRPVRQPPGSIV